MNNTSVLQTYGAGYNKYMEKIDDVYMLVCPWPWNIDPMMRKLYDGGYFSKDIK